MTGKRVAEETVAPAAKRIETESQTAPSEDKEPRRPKRKVAVQLGYCGTGYHGMQLNEPHKTIEGDLFQAFVKAGAVSKDNANDPKKSSFLRAARTDKGVHAAGNVVSLKMIVEDEDIVDRINSHLPDQIRVWGYTRTNKSFECRKMCSSRVYEYILPTYTLMSPNPNTPLGQRLAALDDLVTCDAEKEEAEKFWSGLAEALEKQGISQDDLKALDTEAAKLAAEAKIEKDGTVKAEAKTDADAEANGEIEKTLTPLEAKRKEVKAIANEYRRTYRAIPERINRLRDVLNEYLGVHNFHNYTVGKHFKDPSATRVMKSLTVSEPKLIDGTEWVSIKIHGQSFMLHQIRKMIAMAVLVVRSGVPKERISGLFDKVKIGIPKAPALGLLLEQPVYDGYNARLEKLGRDHITFDQYADKIEAFKTKYIYDKIYAQEAKENEFHAFFAFIDTYRVSELLDYLTGTKTDKPAQQPVGPVDDSDEEAAAEDNEG